MTMTQHSGRTGRIPSTDVATSIRRDWGPLVRLIALLAVTGAALLATAGPPRLPTELPDVDLLLATLRGTSIPLAGLGYVLSLLAWAIWGWLTLSLLLQLGVALAEVATHGAAWVRSLRRATNVVTLPLVRRAVDSALAVAMVVQVAAHAAPAAAAELPPPPPAIVHMVGGHEDVAVRQHAARSANYTVQKSDTLWTIAERFYGTGHEYPRLVDANAGRDMGNGALFPDNGVIEPGWVLRVPLPSTALEEHDGEVFYTVERGDTLWGISARFLGDPLRWPEIYEQNRGAAMADGRALHDPNLIWPELRLSMPMAVEAEAPADIEQAPMAVEGAAIQAADSGAQLEAAPHIEANGSDLSGAAGAAGAAGAVALAGAAIGALMVRRRGRRGLDEPPLGDQLESDFIVRGGFAELGDVSRTRTEPAQVAARETLRYLAERGLDGRVGLVSTRHGRSGTTLALVSQRLADRPRIVEAASGLSQRLGTPVHTQISRDHDVLVRCGPLRALQPLAGSAGASQRILPLGVLPDRRVLSVNWPALGHVLIAGRARGAVSSLLGTLVANLAAQTRPEELQIMTIARDQHLSSTLQRLPHQVGTPIDPGDHLATTAAMHDIRAELVRRMERAERGGPVETLQELVLVVPELDALTEHLSTLEMIGAYGPAHRVRLLAASTHSRALPDRLVAHFVTRAVLRLPDEAESTRLLGTPGAVDLLGGGQVLVRLDEREPLELYGFRIAEPELDRLVRSVRGEPPRPTPPATRLPVLEADENDVDEDMDDEVSAARPAVRDVPLGPRPRGPLIEVRCLGGFDVVAGEHDLTMASSPAEAAERAGAWELLAFLGSQPEGVVAREDVLVALWPDADGRAANRSLIATVDRLNALLEPALGEREARPVVWLDDRDGTCRLDLSRVESDVHRFVRLCHAAPLMPPEQAAEAWARARELYHGGLLDGPGARAYQWAATPAEDGELSLKEALREQFYRATLRQARALVRSGELRPAIELFHALLDVEPLLEDVVRDLYRCYAELGDLNALVDEEQRLRQALRRASGPEDDPDPEPATVSLFMRVREDLELRASVPA